MAKRAPMEVQSVILSKGRFDTLKEAKKYVKDHGWLTVKVDENETQFRFRQEEPEYFRKTTFRNKKIADGVSLIVAKRRGKTVCSEGVCEKVKLGGLRISEKMASPGKAKAKKTSTSPGKEATIRHGLQLIGGAWVKVKK